MGIQRSYQGASGEVSSSTVKRRSPSRSSEGHPQATAEDERSVPVTTGGTDAYPQMGSNGNRLVDPTDDHSDEASLRPLSFADYVGQEHLKKNLRVAIDAVKKRDDGTTLDHVLLYGPPGLGKTTMANIIAHELGANLRVTTGPEPPS